MNNAVSLMMTYCRRKVSANTETFSCVKPNSSPQCRVFLEVAVILQIMQNLLLVPPLPDSEQLDEATEQRDTKKEREHCVFV